MKVPDHIKHNWKGILFASTLLFALLSSILIYNVSSYYNTDNHLTLLAAQFVKGHISLEPNDTLPLGDIAKYNGKFYLYFAPLPSILLAPLVLLFKTSLSQVVIGIASMTLSFIVAVRLAQKLKYQGTDAGFLGLFFVFSTPMYATGLINITAFQVQSLGVLLLLLGLYLYIDKKHPLLVGLLFGLAFLTRTLLLISVAFFVFEVLQKNLKFNKFLLIFLPVFACMVLMGAYNYLRFQNIFDTGISHSITLYTYPLSLNIEHGMTSLSHLPSNLYAMLLMPPEPVVESPDAFHLIFPYLKANPWGMAIWFTSPLLLLLFARFKATKVTISALTTVVLFLIPIFSFYSIGFTQYGYRYMLDFLPFLFLLLLVILNRPLNKYAIFLIVLGVVFNSLMIASLWGVYPHFGIHL